MRFAPAAHPTRARPALRRCPSGSFTNGPASVTYGRFAIRERFHPPGPCASPALRVGWRLCRARSALSDVAVTRVLMVRSHRGPQRHAKPALTSSYSTQILAVRARQGPHRGVKLVFLLASHTHARTRGRRSPRGRGRAPHDFVAISFDLCFGEFVYDFPWSSCVIHINVGKFTLDACALL